jgi:hypothetical protein
MKYSNETERRLLSVCWLREREMRDLLVKNVVWKEKRLYVVFKERQIEPFPDIPQGRDSLKGYEHVIWMVGESWLPVIARQEQESWTFWNASTRRLSTRCSPVARLQ